MSRVIVNIPERVWTKIESNSSTGYIRRPTSAGAFSFFYTYRDSRGVAPFDSPETEFIQLDNGKALPLFEQTRDVEIFSNTDIYLWTYNSDPDSTDTASVLIDLYSSGSEFDAFGKSRTSFSEQVFESKQITSRQLGLWEERLFGSIINHGTVTAGPFVSGEIITGGTSGKTGVVTALTASALTYDTSNNDFEDGETITGTTSGASAAITNHDTGSHIEYNYNRSSSFLKVGALSGQRVVRQTIRYMPYTPKKGQVYDVTGVGAGFKTGVRQYILYGDDLNAIGMCVDENEAALLIRTNTSGSPVTDIIPQSQWNQDKLNGAGPSGITLDVSKIQINEGDFAWLAAGNTRYFYSVNGKPVLVHVIEHANIADVAWMRTPSLPLRFEIENISSTASPTQLEQICASVESDGGYEPPGFEFSVGNETNRVSVVAKTLLLAVRLKNNCPDLADHPNRKTVKYQRHDVSSKVADCYWELVHVHTPYIEASGDWNDLWGDPDSGVEFSTNLIFTAGHVHEIDSGYSLSGQAGKGGTLPRESTGISYHGFINQNFESNQSQMFVLYGTRDGASGTASVAVTFGGKILE